MQEQAPLRARRQFGCLPGAENIMLQAGQLIEILGAGQMSYAAKLFQAREDTCIAWMSHETLEAFPMALVQEKVALSRILFLEQVKETQGMDILLTVLKSQLFEVVLFDQIFLPKRNIDAQIKKLSFLAEESGAILLLLSQSKTSSYGVTIRVETEDAEGVQLQKIKGGLA